MVTSLKRWKAEEELSAKSTGRKPWRQTLEFFGANRFSILLSNDRTPFLLLLLLLLLLFGEEASLNGLMQMNNEELEG